MSLPHNLLNMLSTHSTGWQHVGKGRALCYNSSPRFDSGRSKRFLGWRQISSFLPPLPHPHTTLWQNSWTTGSTLWMEATRNNCMLPGYKSGTLSKFPGCMRSRSPWQLLWSEEIFLHHTILSSCSILSIQWWPQEHSLKILVKRRTRMISCHSPH